MNSLMIKLTFLFFIIFISCQKIEKESKQHLRINIVDEIESIDPRKAKDVNCITVMKMIYEGLTRTTKDNHVELALAKEVKVSEDFMTYTFILKETVWENGKPCTSFDFAKGWKKALDPSFPSVMSYKLYVIEGAKEAKEGLLSLDDIGIYTPDPLMLVVRLKQPVPYFLELLSMPIFFPMAEEEGRKEENTLCIGNGPFKVEKWSHHSSLELIKNKKYWDSKNIKLEKLSLFMVNEETELNMYETKEIDLAGSPFSSLPIDSIKNLSKLDAFVKKPLLGTSFLRINMNWISKAFDSEEKALLFRRAFAYSIDRQKIATHALSGRYETAKGFLPPPFSHEEFILESEKEEIINEFKNMELEEPVKISFINNDCNCLFMQALQRQWEEILKIKVELHPLERKVYLHNLFSGKYQMALGSWIADINDPINFLEIFKYRNSGMNNTFWENPEYIDLLNRAAICIKKEDRLLLVQKAHRLLMDEMPIIPIFSLNMCYLINEKVKNVAISPVGTADYRWVYIEE